jgi:hypothetical protein
VRLVINFGFGHILKKSLVKKRNFLIYFFYLFFLFWVFTVRKMWSVFFSIITLCSVFGG